jgi:hypothetical protein
MRVWKDKIRMILGKKQGGELWPGCMWLRVGISGRVL